MTFIKQLKGFLIIPLFLSVPLSSGFAIPPVDMPSAPAAEKGGLGVIKGLVLDNAGSPIADATVAIFRVGTSQLLKQVRSASDGSFLAKILPGTYTVLAVAEGFNPVTLAAIEVDKASQLNYGFKLERAGNGNTLPEKRRDRNNPKWNIRAAQISRSIYQNTEGATPAADTENVDAAAVETAGPLKTIPKERARRSSKPILRALKRVQMPDSTWRRLCRSARMPRSSLPDR